MEAALEAELISMDGIRAKSNFLRCLCRQAGALGGVWRGGGAGGAAGHRSRLLVSLGPLLSLSESENDRRNIKRIFVRIFDVSSCIKPQIYTLIHVVSIFSFIYLFWNNNVGVS